MLLTYTSNAIINFPITRNNPTSGVTFTVSGKSSTISTKAPTAYIGQTFPSGYISSSTSFIPTNSINNGVLHCNAFICNNIGYKTLTPILSLTSVVPKTQLNSIDNIIIGTGPIESIGSITGTTGNDNYSYSIYGSTNPSGNIYCGYIAIPNNTASLYDNKRFWS